MKALAGLLVLVAGAASAQGQGQGTTHTVFDLVANRPLAHEQVRGGLFIDAGAVGFPKYLRFGRPQPWKLAQKDGALLVAGLKGGGKLLVPLTAEQAASGVVALRVRVGKAGRVGVTVDKQKAVAEVTPGWNTAVARLPAGALKAGDNLLALDVPGDIALHWVQVGGEAPSVDAGPPPVELSPEGGLAYYVVVPMAGAFEAVLAGDATCKPWLRVTTTGMAPMMAQFKPGKAAASLAAYSGKPVRLALGVNGCPRLSITSAGLTVPGAAPQRLTAKPPSNVIIWLTDNTRADKVRTFNPKARAETPVLDGLAKRGALFMNAYAQGNESRLSHASLWTSMYPVVHGMISGEAVLPSKWVTMAEAVKPTGLTTLGISANGYINKRWGFGDGWDAYKNHLHEGGGLMAEHLVAGALKMLEKRWDKRFFMYIGSIDAHVSWKAHEPWLSKYDGEHGPYTGKYKKALYDPELDLIAAGKVKLSDRDKQRVVALYDADISYNDQQLGVLLAELEKRGHKDDTMIIVTSDHGEEFWEHGKIGHGQSSREELTHVPLLIVYPPLLPPGTVIDEAVDVMDAMPTVLDALGGKAPADWQGMSLLPLAQGLGRGYPTAAVTTQYENAHSMRVGRWKMRVGGDGEASLHEIPVDPFERTDVIDKQPEARRVLTDAMSLFLVLRKQWKKSLWGTPSNLLPGFGR